MFYEDLGADTYQDETADDLSVFSDFCSPLFTELDSDIWEDKSDHSDHESREVYARDTCCERYTDSQGIDARRDTEDDERSDREYISLLARLTLGAPSLVDHVGSYVA